MVQSNKNRYTFSNKENCKRERVSHKVFATYSSDECFKEDRKVESMTTQNETFRPYFLRTDEGEASWYLSTRCTLKATSESTGGALGLVEAKVLPGMAAPWHVHHREDEMFYLLEGKVLFKCGDELFQADPGSFVFLPRDIPHSYKNVGETTARWLILTTPAGVERYFVEAGVPALDEGIRPQPPDPQKLAAISAKYGLEILGPAPF
jgi:quercetin dioxygenase-like cupin family protein